MKFGSEHILNKRKENLLEISAKKISLNDIKYFWSKHPCGSDTSSNSDKKKFFIEVERYRYNKIRSIKEMAEFESYNDKKVLEVGCGIGTDGRQFIQSGAIYTGINLDEGSTNYAREAFNLFGLKGKLCVMNAEELDFENNSFDHIYSHGVIHHSPNTEKIVQEMYRVLKPGGTINIMIYNKSSINYYFEIMLIRKIFRLLLYFPKSPYVISKITGFNQDKLLSHKNIMLNEKMTKNRWISINTDGPDCPLAKVYNKQQSTKLFMEQGFIDIDHKIRYFNKEHYSFLGKLIPYNIADLIGKIGGWHRWVRAIKPL